MTTISQSFTKQPLASMRQVAFLSFSYTLVLFSGSLMGLCDRIILAHSSLQSFEASVSAFSLVQFFQIPLIRIVSVAQMFVSQYNGANEKARMGPIIWQMIWLSLLSMLFILPISFPMSQIFFKNSAIQSEGSSYFRILVNGNFLFTIAAALSCFHLARGKVKKIIFISLACQILNLFLDFTFVFGVKGWFSPMGTKGAAFASVIAEAFFCFVLLLDFLKIKYRSSYGTGEFFFRKSLFLQALKLGISRGIARFLPFFSWIIVNRIILQQNQPEYLVILTFGGALSLFSLCFLDAMTRTVTAIGGYVIGAKKPLIWKTFRSAFYFLTIMSIVLTIFSLLFKDILIALFFKEELSAFLKQQLYLSLFWVCLYFYTNGLNGITFGLLNAYGDPKFQIAHSLTFTIITGFLPVYLLIHIAKMPPHVLWFISAFHCFACFLGHLFRLRQEKWKNRSVISQTPITSK